MKATSVAAAALKESYNSGDGWFDSLQAALDILDPPPLAEPQPGQFLIDKKTGTVFAVADWIYEDDHYAIWRINGSGEDRSPSYAPIRWWKDKYQTLSLVETYRGNVFSIKDGRG